MLPITRTQRDAAATMARRPQSLRRFAEGIVWVVFWLCVVSLVLGFIGLMIFYFHWFALALL